MTKTETPDRIPDRALDPKTFKKLLMDQVRARGGTQSVDTKELLQNLVKDTLRPFSIWRWNNTWAIPSATPEARQR